MKGFHQDHVLLKIELLSTIDMLKEISSEWMELYNLSLTATPFQALYWIIPWWKNFGKSELVTVSIRDDKKLICTAPFFIYTENQIKKLCLIGSGISDYLDVLYIDKWDEQVSETIGFFLSSISELWDECFFQDIPETSPLVRLSEYMHSYNVKTFMMNKCSFINADKVSNIRDILPKKLRKNIQNSLNRINVNHSLSLVQRFSPEELILLHKQRWVQKGAQGVLNDENIQKIHFDIFQSEYQNNEVSIYTLMMDDVTIACYYVLKKNKNAYFYLSGFDPLFKKYSPGTLALFMIIEQLFKEGFCYFDFLRGNEIYKYHWGVSFKQNYGIQITKI